MKAAPAFGGKQRLVRREAQRHIHHNAVLRQRAAGFEPVPGERHLDRDIVRNRRQLAPLGEYGFRVHRRNLCADRAFDDAADLADSLEEVAAGLGNQRRVGGDAIEQASRGELADFGYFGRVYEEFHGCLPFAGRIGTKCKITIAGLRKVNQQPEPAPADPIQIRSLAHSVGMGRGVGAKPLEFTDGYMRSISLQAFIVRK